MNEFWKHPADEAPPRGEEILLYTGGGVMVVGNWGDDCILWAPRPKLSKELKARIEGERPGLFGRMHRAPNDLCR